MATFPGENEGSYYIPSEKDDAASGRLYQTYKSVREELAGAGIITKRVVVRKKNVKPESVTKTVVTSINVNAIDVSISMEYLAMHTDNKEELNQHWCNSRLERFVLLNNATVNDYIEKFPILSMADGFEWLNLDFEQQFPAAKNAMNKWKEFSPKLMSYVSKKAKRNKNIREVIDAYDGSEAALLLLSFKILPWILRSPTRGGKTSTSRPNQLEVSDNFICHFNTDNDDTRKVAGFIEVKLIGSNSIYHTYVYLNKIQYVFPDVLAGIDCAFKLHYVFNLKFPKTTEHIWEFLNLAIYDINTKGRQVANYEVLSDIRRDARRFKFSIFFCSIFLYIE